MYRSLFFKTYHRRGHCALASVFISSYAFAASISFVGQKHDILSFEPVKSSGLDMLYVAFDAAEISEMMIEDPDSKITIEKYSNLGGGFAVPVDVEYTSGFAVLHNPSGDTGYIINDGNKPYYIWLINYADHYCRMNTITLAENQDCDHTIFKVLNEVPPIQYYSIDGRPCELSRDIILQYDNLVWNDEADYFANESQTEILNHIGPELYITPPLFCSSIVQLKGDRFLEKWNLGQAISVTVSHPNGLNVHTEVEQESAFDSDDDRPLSNVINGDNTGLGGSAPADITFLAQTTDAVIHDEWQIAADSNFENILYRFNEKEIDFTFDSEGEYFARFIGSNADGSCEAYSDIYEISIGASDLRIPNAFSPNDDGVNDVWKVAYRSLLSFNCWIFDRYGNELYHFSDPNGGWDGKVRGKKVKSGVYYYVIEAKGADGKNYKKSGDINIIDYRRIGGTVE